MKFIQDKEMFESVINRDEDFEVFNYNEIIDDIWFDKVNAAKDFQNIDFDLENNDSLKEKKTIFVTKNLRKDQPVKYEINAELCRAGGDWEWPVMYFRVEFTHEYFYDKVSSEKIFIWDNKKSFDEKLNQCYVIIPPIEAGNTLLKDGDVYRAYQEEDLDSDNAKEKAEITDAKKELVWKWLIDTITKYIDDNHETLD